MTKVDELYKWCGKTMEAGKVLGVFVTTSGQVEGVDSSGDSLHQ